MNDADKIRQLLDALRFYAAPENWAEQESGIGMLPSDADSDCGTIARAALEKYDQ